MERDMKAAANMPPNPAMEPTARSCRRRAAAHRARSADQEARFRTTQIESLLPAGRAAVRGSYSQATPSRRLHLLRRSRSAYMEESVLMALRRTTSFVFGDEHA
jgi:hypothetical protein